jgi:hypothetical protein
LILIELYKTIQFGGSRAEQGRDGRYLKESGLMYGRRKFIYMPIKIYKTIRFVNFNVNGLFARTPPSWKVPNPLGILDEEVTVQADHRSDPGPPKEKGQCLPWGGHTSWYPVHTVRSPSLSISSAMVIVGVGKSILV